MIVISYFISSINEQGIGGNCRIQYSTNKLLVCLYTIASYKKFYGTMGMSARNEVMVEKTASNE
jgi:hypothetical protein